MTSLFKQEIHQVKGEINVEGKKLLLLLYNLSHLFHMSNDYL